MVNRRYNKKRNYSNFSNTVKTVGNVARTATAAMGAAKLVLSLINPEFKYNDFISGANVSNTTAKYHLLNGISRGTDSTNRIGRSIKVKSIEINMYMYASTSATTEMFARFILILDKEPNGLAPSFGDILQSTSSPTNLISPRNLDNRKRFIILKDQLRKFSSSGNNDAQGFEFYKKMDFHTIYNAGDTGTISDIDSNSLYLCVVGSDPSSTHSPIYNFYSRIRYLDN